MRVKTGLWVLLIAAVLQACQSTPSVNTDFDPSYNFSGAGGFAVLQPNFALSTVSGQPLMNELTFARIKRHVEGALVARGYRIVSADQADMIVTFLVTTENKADVRTYNTGVHYGRCWNTYRCAGWIDPEIDVRHYKEGALFIDFLDARTKSLKWRGVTTKRLPAKASEAEREAIVSEVVSAIIGSFPP